MKTVIEMAKEAGFACESNGEIYIDHRDGVCTENLNSFAELIRADEREEIKQVVEKELLNTIALMSMPQKSSAAWNILMAIRARSNT